MSVTVMSPSHCRPWRPGFLVSPLGWLNEALAKILTRDHELFLALFELDVYRMHVLGLGVAHLDPAQLSSAIIENLTRRSPQTSLRQILGSWPQGLDRVLHTLPDTIVLAPQYYRALIALLYDRAAAAHLHHYQSITEPLIIALDALPPLLRRPPIFKLLDDIDGMDRFVAGLQFLCDRVEISFNDFVQELGSFNQTEQVRARIAALADRLPLPDRLPRLEHRHLPPDR